MFQAKRAVAAILAILFLLAGPAAFAAPQSVAPADGAANPQNKILGPAADAAIGEIYRSLADMTPEELAATLKLFRVRRLIKSLYVDNTAGAGLMTGAVRGAVAAIGDPYTDYLDAKALKDLLVEVKGSFGGVGLVLGMRDKQIVVIAPIEGTPADQAGIASGDRILAIDGQSTKEMALDEAVAMIRGPEGTDVTLTVGRGTREPRDYYITRATIQIKSVTGKMLDDGIGYVRLSYFNENTGEDLDAKLRDLESQGMKALILDLRGNPGGLIDESVKVAGHFIPSGPVVSVVTRDGKRRDLFPPHPADIAGPLVVLINSGSASASEIVAGAIQDTGAGTIVGTTSFGKGSVQSLFPLDSDTALKLTTAKYHTPKDRVIHGTGIEPDIFVALPEDFRDSRVDTQLDKAIEILKEKLQQ